jgi:hypothetical protein
MWKEFAWNISEPGKLRILFRNERVGHSPRNVDIGIIPGNPVLVRRIIKVAALIKELN